MVTNKIRAIWQIVRADHVMVFTKKSEGNVKSFGFGRGNLHDIMLMAVEFKRTYNNTVKLVEQGATEQGTLHAFMEMKEAIEELEKNGQ